MRSWILMSLCLTAALSGCKQSQPATPRAPRVVIYKSPSCGCCVKWEVYVRSRGFEVASVMTDDIAAVKAKHGVPAELASCHTATVEGYVLEGHVPVQSIQRLLSERPAARGLVVSGMPAGAPGMGGEKTGTWTIYAFTKDGKAPTVYATQ